MNSDAASLLVSVAALLIAAWSAWTSRQSQAEQLRLQTRLLALEATRERAKVRQGRQAKLAAKIDKQGRSWRLVVANTGSATATGVQMRLDGAVPESHPLWVQGQDLLDRFGAGVDASYILGVAMDKPRSFAIDLTWSDESGEPGSWSSQLKI